LRTVSVPTVDAIDEVTENFSIASELLRLGTIIDNNNALWQRSSATEGSAAVTLHIIHQSNHYLYFMTNGTAGSADYDY
jgi:hypothetical protein